MRWLRVSGRMPGHGSAQSCLEHSTLKSPLFFDDPSLLFQPRPLCTCLLANTYLQELRYSKLTKNHSLVSHWLSSNSAVWQAWFTQCHSGGCQAQYLRTLSTTEACNPRSAMANTQLLSFLQQLMSSGLSPGFANLPPTSAPSPTLGNPEPGSVSLHAQTTHVVD